MPKILYNNADCMYEEIVDNFDRQPQTYLSVDSINCKDKKERHICQWSLSCVIYIAVYFLLLLRW
jgi:hypothetical protein